MPLATIEEVLEDLKKGKMIILVDDEDRENEGDLTMAAEKATPEAINFMATYGRGLICLPMASHLLEKLNLPQMVADNCSPYETAFTVSIEARTGVTTGISAADRAQTILVAVADGAKPEDLVQPGHVFPLRARRGGVLFRTGQTEGSVDLARLAGLKPAGVICEIMKDDGTMARMPDLEVFAEKHKLKIASVADIIEYRMRTESFVHLAAETVLPTPHGEFRAMAFVNDIDTHEHLVLVKGDIDPEQEILVRVHSQCTPGDIFNSIQCGCRAKLDKAMELVQQEDQGVIIYIQQEGRGLRLAQYQALEGAGQTASESHKEDCLEADLRNYGVGAQILVALGVKKMRLLTNNPKKIKGLEGYDLEVVGRVPLETEQPPVIIEDTKHP
ncbi:MAG: 3,4-dihydroxy-2-butanone-4-phosphate synthase [Deltaproteobacteria bacterium]|nr:3,4-dihydroxy-2-butanone-4-phosphate synthase [Deltaproteobacteria bacterium]